MITPGAISSNRSKQTAPTERAACLDRFERIAPTDHADGAIGEKTRHVTLHASILRLVGVAVDLSGQFRVYRMSRDDLSDRCRADLLGPF